MKKKVILILLVIFVCACSNKIQSLDEYFEEFVERNDDLAEVIEVLDCKEYKDAQIGLVLVKDNIGDEIIYLNWTVIDEDLGFYSESHRDMEILYIYSEAEIYVKPSPDKEYESDPKKNYYEIESEGKKYYTGIVRGSQKIEYNGKKAYFKQLKFDYRGNEEKTTFWIVELSNKDANFNIDKLTY